MKEEGIPLVGIGPQDVLKGNRKLVLGLVWTLILHYHIQRLLLEDRGARPGRGREDVSSSLLGWVRERLRGYNVAVKDFRASFKDGRVFCCLVDAMKPGVIDVASLDAQKAELNCKLAFSKAEEVFGIPSLLDSAGFDELSTMLYVSYFKKKERDVRKGQPLERDSTSSSKPIAEESHNNHNTPEQELQEQERQRVLREAKEKEEEQVREREAKEKEEARLAQEREKQIAEAKERERLLQQEAKEKEAQKAKEAKKVQEVEEAPKGLRQSQENKQPQKVEEEPKGLRQSQESKQQQKEGHVEGSSTNKKEEVAPKVVEAEPQQHQQQKKEEPATKQPSTSKTPSLAAEPATTTPLTSSSKDKRPSKEDLAEPKEGGAKKGGSYRGEDKHGTSNLKSKLAKVKSLRRNKEDKDDKDKDKDKKKKEKKEKEDKKKKEEKKQKNTKNGGGSGRKRKDSAAKNEKPNKSALKEIGTLADSTGDAIPRGGGASDEGALLRSPKRAQSPSLITPGSATPSPPGSPLSQLLDSSSGSGISPSQIERRRLYGDFSNGTDSEEEFKPMVLDVGQWKQEASKKSTLNSGLFAQVSIDADDEQIDAELERLMELRKAAEEKERLQPPRASSTSPIKSTVAARVVAPTDTDKDSQTQQQQQPIESAPVKMPKFSRLMMKNANDTSLAYLGGGESASMQTQSNKPKIKVSDIAEIPQFRGAK